MIFSISKACAEPLGSTVARHGTACWASSTCIITTTVALLRRIRSGPCQAATIVSPCAAGTSGTGDCYFGYGLAYKILSSERLQAQ